MRCVDMFKMLPFLLLSCLIIHTSSQFACPSGWTQHAEYCYFIINTPKMSWTEATGRCRAAGGELALPVTKEDTRFLWTMFQAQNLSAAQLQPYPGVWLGCRRLAGVWSCSNTPVLDFARWNPGHPDGTGDCVTMWHDAAKWSDVICEKTMSAACQRRSWGKCARQGRCHQRGGPGHQIHGCLLNHILKEVQVRDPAICCIKCVDDPRCRSFNLVGSSCQLNTAQHSDVNFSGETATNDTCFYYEID